MDALGDWVLRTACGDAARLPLQTIAVNVSPLQFRDPSFAERVLAILQETGLEASRLELEITETALLENADLFAPMIAKLREAGIRVALDDFGTGFSSLTHLRQIKVDRVKIDRSFVGGLGRNASDNAFVQVIVDLAGATGLRITAEGVETAEQSDVLTRMGCDELQGFLLARPMSILQVAALLRGAAAGQRRRAGIAPRRLNTPPGARRWLSWTGLAHRAGARSAGPRKRQWRHGYRHCAGRVRTLRGAPSRARR